jgi:hypothetical protein
VARTGPQEPAKEKPKAKAKESIKEPVKVTAKSGPQLAPVQPAVVSIGPAAPSSQSPSVTWMAMASDDDPLARALAAVDAEDAAAAGGKRQTKDRLPTVGNSSSPDVGTEQVLQAIGSRDRVDEWQLAQELGVSLGELQDVLGRLEDQGAIRLVPGGIGQRIVTRL